MKKARLVNNEIGKFYIICSVLLALIVFPLHTGAQTWKKQGKVATPVAALNAACNSATDTIGILSDRSSLLICQSGVWRLPQAQNLYTLEMYSSNENDVPAPCPSGWSDLGAYHENTLKGGYWFSTNQRRVCTGPKHAFATSCGTGSNECTPAACPFGYTFVGKGSKNEAFTGSTSYVTSYNYCVAT